MISFVAGETGILTAESRGKSELNYFNERVQINQSLFLQEITFEWFVNSKIKVFSHGFY